MHNRNMDSHLPYNSILELQHLMSTGDLTSREMVLAYLARIEANDRQGPALRAVIETNPDAESIAAELDEERKTGRTRGPMHGTPILLKDNIDTADRMHTTAGSLALLEARPARDAHIAAQLRTAGVVILGKTNMSEWANFRSEHSSSGWSARGGQARNPYVLDRSPCGSSSGSATAVAAGYVPASIGTETAGSILCPAAMNGVVGIKPTVGLTSRRGVIPISHTQDVVGPFGRTVADAAALLSAIAGPDREDKVTARSPSGIDYTSYLSPAALRGARIGVPRETYYGYSPKTDAVVEDALRAMRDLGAEIVDPANISTSRQMNSDNSMYDLLLYEFKADLNAYLAGLGPDAPVHDLAEVIAFNRDHAREEMPYFGQDVMEKSQEKGPLTDRTYRDALKTCRRLSREEGIDAVMAMHHLDALVAPTAGPAWPIDLVNGDASSGGCSAPTALAGYPAISVPIGYVSGLPVGLTFMGRAWDEPLLIRLAYALEQVLEVWRPPEFLPTIGWDAA